jgi:hypothetical protein
MRVAGALAAAFVLVGCEAFGGEAPDTSGASGGGSDASEDAGDGNAGPEEIPVPTDAVGLSAFLTSAAYRDWPGEALPHPSSGTHFGAVRTFVNPSLAATLGGGSLAHAVGAAAVKELYAADGTVVGWAVSKKIAPQSAGGAGWYWFEVYQGTIQADGVGLGTCTGCHATGRDFILTPTNPID